MAFGGYYPALQGTAACLCDTAAELPSAPSHRETSSLACVNVLRHTKQPRRRARRAFNEHLELELKPAG